MKRALLLLVLFVSSVIVVPAAIAQTDTQVYLHFDKPIEIPGQVLQAGTYLFVPVQDDENVIQVFDAHRTKLFATLYTVPASESGQPSDKLQVSIAEQADGTPALLDVFFPGGMDGFELLYPKKQEKQLSASRTDVISTPDGSLASGD